jgi:hypothetical protein
MILNIGQRGANIGASFLTESELTEVPWPEDNVTMWTGGSVFVEADHLQFQDIRKPGESGRVDWWAILLDCPRIQRSPGACCPMAISAAPISRTTTVKPGRVGSTFAATSSMLRHCQAVDPPHAHPRGSEPCHAASCSNGTAGELGQVSRTSHDDDLVLPKPRTTSTWLAERGSVFRDAERSCGGNGLGQRV